MLISWMLLGIEKKTEKINDCIGFLPEQMERQGFHH